jgi:hypothetical protein
VILLVPAAGERSEVGGLRQSIGEFRSADMVLRATRARPRATQTIWPV